MPKSKGKNNKPSTKGKSKQPKPGTIGAVKQAAFSGYGGKAGKRYAQSQAQLQYGPQARQIKAEQRASGLQSLRLRKDFRQYNKSLKPLQKQTTKAYDQAASGIAADNKALGEYGAKLQAQLNSEGQTSAAARGVGYTPDTAGSQAALARYATGNTLGAVTRSQGASQRAYGIEQKRIGKREKIDALQQEANRGRSYNQDLQNLARQKGAAASVASKENRDSASSLYLGLLSARNTKRGQQVTKRGQNLTAQSSANSTAASVANSQRSAATSAANSRRSAATSRANSRRTAQNSRRSARTSRANSRRSAAGSSGGSGGVDPTHVGHMVGLLNGLTGKKKQTALSNPAKAKHDLVGESTTFTGKEANIAYARWRKRQGGGGGGHSQATGGHRPG